MTIMLPEGHEAAAITRLADLQLHQSLLDRPLVVVDMRLPDRLAVRAKVVSGTDVQAPETHAPDPRVPDPGHEAPRDTANRRAT
jgi:cell division protein FtsQ